jgi:hypothetical protein
MEHLPSRESKPDIGCENKITPHLLSNSLAFQELLDAISAKCDDPNYKGPYYNPENEAPQE